MRTGCHPRPLDADDVRNDTEVSWGGKPVEADAGGGEPRVMEVQHATRKGIRLHRNPMTRAQIRAGFHDDRDVRCADHDAVEAVRRENYIVECRVPQEGGGSPARLRSSSLRTAAAFSVSVSGSWPIMWIVSNTVAGATCLKLVQAGVQARDGDFCKWLFLQRVGIVCPRLPKLNVEGSIPFSRSTHKLLIISAFRVLHHRSDTAAIHQLC